MMSVNLRSTRLNIYKTAQNEQKSALNDELSNTKELLHYHTHTSLNYRKILQFFLDAQTLWVQIHGSLDVVGPNLSSLNVGLEINRYICRSSDA